MPSQKHPTIAMWVPDSCQKLQGFSRGEVEDWCILFFFQWNSTPRKFNMEPKMMVSKRNLLFQSAIFRFHVKLWEGIFCAILFSFLFSLFCFLFCVFDSIISYHRPFKSRHIESYHFMSNHITSQRNIYIYMYIYIYIYACIYLQKKTVACHRKDHVEEPF